MDDDRIGDDAEVLVVVDVPDVTGLADAELRDQAGLRAPAQERHGLLVQHVVDGIGSEARLLLVPPAHVGSADEEDEGLQIHLGIGPQGLDVREQPGDTVVPGMSLVRVGGYGMTSQRSFINPIASL